MKEVLDFRIESQGDFIYTYTPSFEFSRLESINRFLVEQNQNPRVQRVMRGFLYHDERSFSHDESKNTSIIENFPLCKILRITDIHVVITLGSMGSSVNESALGKCNTNRFIRNNDQECKLASFRR